MKPPIIFLILPEMILTLVVLRPQLGNARHFDSSNVNSLSSKVCGQSKHSNQNRGRVMGGDESRVGEFPWITSIQSSEGQHFCAGFMVSSRFIISAAHCFCNKYNRHVKYRDDNRTVVLDSMKVAISRVKLNDPGPLSKVIEIKNLIIHPQFEIDELNNDIAILELQNDMEWNNVLNPICLPEIPDEDQNSGDVTVAGWGYRQCGSSSVSNELHQITVPLWSAEECQKSYEDADYAFNRRDYVCAGSDGKDVSKGDSGGPLMFMDGKKRWVAIGIVSSGKFFCSDRVPGVYTKLSSYIGWIKSQIE